MINSDLRKIGINVYFCENVKWFLFTKIVYIYNEKITLQINCILTVKSTLFEKYIFLYCTNN